MTYVKSTSEVFAINFCVQLILKKMKTHGCFKFEIIHFTKFIDGIFRNHIPCEGGVTVPTLVAVEVLVGLSDLSGLLPFTCFVPFVPNWFNERCSWASFCSFFFKKNQLFMKEFL